jgi:Chloroplast import apparatus Tic20-like
MTWRESTSVAERILAALPYLLPLIDVLEFGRFLFKQFSFLPFIFYPLLPLLQIYSIPFAGLIIFFALFFLVVRNEKSSYFVRFNTMQAILIDIVLIATRLIVSIGEPTLQKNTFFVETLYNTIFLGFLGILIYSVAQLLLGHYAEIPTISDAVRKQVS